MIRRMPIQVGRRRLEVSNLDKVLYPSAGDRAGGFTKGDVIDYYSRIAPYMLPHLRKRPISLKRFPDGVNGKSFYQKNCPGHRPDWVNIANVQRQRGSEETIEYCMVDSAAALLWMANLAALELHTHLSTTDDINRPTMMVFDLDPGPGTTLLDCLHVAQEMRELLQHLDLQSFLKTSGGKGAHLLVPLNTPVTFEETKAYARALAEILERRHPQRITTTMRRDVRNGKIFVDWSQNDRHKTTVSVYSLRARPRPMVSAPISWDEVDAAVRAENAGALEIDAQQMLKRVERMGDLLAPVLANKQELKAFA